MSLKKCVRALSNTSILTQGFLACISHHVQYRVLAHKVARAKGKEVGGAGIVHQQLDHSRAHPPIPLVDQVIPEYKRKKILVIYH